MFSSQFCLYFAAFSLKVTCLSPKRHKNRHFSFRKHNSSGNQLCSYVINLSTFSYLISVQSCLSRICIILFNFLCSLIFKSVCVLAQSTRKLRLQGARSILLLLSLYYMWTWRAFSPIAAHEKDLFFGKGREDGELEEAIYFAKQISSRFSMPAWMRPPFAWRKLKTSGAGFWGLGLLLHFKLRLYFRNNFQVREFLKDVVSMI